MISVRGASSSSAMSTITGRVFAAMPKSASHTSPWRGFIAIDSVQHFLLDLASRQHVRPLVILALTFEEPQVMPQLAKKRLRLLANFLNQPLLSAHCSQISIPAALDATFRVELVRDSRLVPP